VIVRQRPNFGESTDLDLAATKSAAEQSFSRSAEGIICPARVLFPGVALLALKNPLKGIIHDPPVLVEPRYEVS
jgi:hypothetical protein